MAVNSDSKEVKKKSSSNKKKNNNNVTKKKSTYKKKTEAKKDINIIENNKIGNSDEDIIPKEDLDGTIIVSDEELFDKITSDVIENDNYEEKIEGKFTQELDTSYEDIDIFKKKKSNKIIILIIFTSLILFMIYMLLPKIKLNGDNQVTITYNQEYIEKGYKAKLLFRDITNKIIVDSNLDNKTGHDPLDGGQTHRVPYGESDARDHARRGDRHRRGGSRNGSLRLCEPDQQRARVPGHLPRRAGLPREVHQRGDESRDFLCARFADPRRGAESG